MKKFLFLVSIVALAFTAATFVSCSKDDDSTKDIDPEEQPVPAEKYLGLKFWAADDLLAVTDVSVTGAITNFPFDEAWPIKLLNDTIVPGKTAATVEIPKNSNTDKVNITFTLKKDWKTIVGDKEVLFLLFNWTDVHEKDAAVNFSWVGLKGIPVDPKMATDDLINTLLEEFNISFTIVK